VNLCYILTLQLPPRGMTPAAVATYAGVATFAPGTGRNRAYTELFAKYARLMQAEARHSAEPSVLFFSLEPDALEA